MLGPGLIGAAGRPYRAVIGDRLERHLVKIAGEAARLLFPGDAIWSRVAVLLAESDREAYLSSLSQLLELDFDILVPWGGEDGQPYSYGVTRTEAQQNLGRIIDRLGAGENA